MLNAKHQSPSWWCCGTSPWKLRPQRDWRPPCSQHAKAGLHSNVPRTPTLTCRREDQHSGTKVPPIMSHPTPDSLHLRFFSAGTPTKLTQSSRISISYRWVVEDMFFVDESHKNMSSFRSHILYICIILHYYYFLLKY